MSMNGIGGMVRAGAWMDVQLGMEVLSIGRSAEEKADCVLEVCGKWLSFRIALQGGWIWLFAQPLDVCQDWDLLVNVGDGEDGWKTICSLLRALVRHEIKSLQRPIEAGLGPNALSSHEDAATSP